MQEKLCFHKVYIFVLLILLFTTVYCHKCYNIVYLKDPINTFSNMLQSRHTLITIAVTENAINGCMYKKNR